MPGTLQNIKEAWLRRIEAAKALKKRQFSDDAAQAMMLFRAKAAEVWKSLEVTTTSNLVLIHQPALTDRIKPPSFRIVLAKAAEMVQLFGPALYQENPRRIVSPRVRYPLPGSAFATPEAYQQYLEGFRARRERAKIVAEVLTSLLNYLASENELHYEMRRAIDEALIKGMGVLWHEIEAASVGGTPLVATRYDSVDYLFLDPEVDRRSDCTWVARLRCQPYWVVERMFGMPRGYLKRSARYSAIPKDADGRPVAQEGDMVLWYEIYSKRGWGVEINPTDDTKLPPDEQYVYLAICPDHDVPLNLDPQSNRSYHWLVPFWADRGWPFTEIVFHEVPNQIWPMSHLRPGLGHLNFLNWAFSFLAERLRTSTRTIVGVLKAAGEELKSKLLEGNYFDVVELHSNLGQRLQDIISVIQMPNVNTDIWTMIAQVMSEFEKAVGLNELLYGVTRRQIRSATEGKILEAHATTRLDDMSMRVNEAAAKVAKREAFMARWLYEGDDLRRILGEYEAQIWDQYVVPDDIEALIRDFEITIEADSARRPNRAAQLDRLQEMFQLVGPQLVQLAAQGITKPFNAFMRRWARLTGLPDVDEFLLTEEELIQAQMQMQQAQMAIAQQLQQAQGQQSQQPDIKAQADAMKLSIQQQREQLKLQAEQAKQQMKLQQQQMDLAFRAAQHAEKLRQMRELTEARVAQQLAKGMSNGR